MKLFRPALHRHPLLMGVVVCVLAGVLAPAAHARPYDAYGRYTGGGYVSRHYYGGGGSYGFSFYKGGRRTSSINWQSARGVKTYRLPSANRYASPLTMPLGALLFGREQPLCGNYNREPAACQKSTTRYVADVTYE